MKLLIAFLVCSLMLVLISLVRAQFYPGMDRDMELLQQEQMRQQQQQFFQQQQQIPQLKQPC